MVYIDHISFIHLSVDGHLGSFHLLAVVLNMGVQISLQVLAFSSLGILI